MKRFLSTLAAIAAFLVQASAQNIPDTLRISDLYTSHVIFNTDLIYADLSNSQTTAAKIIEQSKNMMALKARSPFSQPMSVSALESNGHMHTFIVVYDSHPGTLVYDLRAADEPAETGTKTRKDGSGDGAAMFRKGDAPLLKDVTRADQQLWHIFTKQYDIEVSCINILSYSDITYMVFSLKNKSGVSYECSDATFVIESKKKTRKSVVYDKNLFPKSRYGTISCAPGEATRIGYCLEKTSLANDQVMRVYFYEQGGQRELVLTIDARDINKAANSL